MNYTIRYDNVSDQCGCFSMSTTTVSLLVAYEMAMDNTIWDTATIVACTCDILHVPQALCIGYCMRRRGLWLITTHFSLTMGCPPRWSEFEGFAQKCTLCQLQDNRLPNSCDLIYHSIYNSIIMQPYISMLDVLCTLFYFN